MEKKNILNKLRWLTIVDGEKRAAWIKKKNLIQSIGDNCLWQSRKYPMDPKLIKIGNNVTIAADVTFCTHDAIRHVAYYMPYQRKLAPHLGCIEVGSNCFIGLGSIIMPNVKIGENTIIGAGSIVTKDIPNGSVVAGCPAKVIGTFDEVIKLREKDEYLNINELWNEFYKKRN